MFEKKKYKKHDFSFQSGPNLMSFALRGGVWGKKSQVLQGNFGIGLAGSFFPSSDPQGEKGFLQPWGGGIMKSKEIFGK